MTNDNFFDADPDRTIVRPTPGGRRTGGPAQQPPQAGAPTPRGPANFEMLSSGNPIIAATVPLLKLIVSVRNCLSMADIASFRQQIEREIKNFEQKISSQSNSDTVLITRYCLCTAIDEAVLNTPWGVNSQWRQESLLVLFHKEAWGGEKFFVILDRMLQDPANRIDILELLYVLLSLGFEGKYRVLDNGQRSLDEIRDRLYLSIRAQRGEPENDLSPQWKGVANVGGRLAQFVPLWVIGVILAALLLASYLGFSYFINTKVSPVSDEFSAVGREAPPQIVATEVMKIPPPPEDTLADKLRTFLQPEIEEGLVKVIDEYGEVRVRILGKGLFKSGSDQLTPKFLPLIHRISDALETETDKHVVIEGHSDSSPIHTVRFPSNWHLSLARAQMVLKIILQNRDLSPSQFQAEGKGDSEPLVDNKTAANRAINRRVEVVLEKN